MPANLAPLETVAPDAVESLLDAAFGSDRHGRTAYRVRAGLAPIADLSFAALAADGGPVGSIQCWPVQLLCPDHVVPLVMVGPVAIHPDHQQRGIGRALMHAVLARTESATIPGAEALMLIGDPDYYGRLFGFTAERTGGWRLPGPVERHRLLARGPGVPGGAGDLGPRARRGLQQDARLA